MLIVACLLMISCESGVSVLTSCEGRDRKSAFHSDAFNENIWHLVNFRNLSFSPSVSQKHCSTDVLVKRHSKHHAEPLKVTLLLQNISESQTYTNEDYHQM